MVGFTGWGQLRGAGGKDGKARGKQLEGLERNIGNNWRYQGTVIDLRVQEVEKVTRWSERRSGVSLAYRYVERRAASSFPGKAELGSTVRKPKHEISLGEENRNYSAGHCWQWDT